MNTTNKNYDDDDIFDAINESLSSPLADEINYSEEEQEILDLIKNNSLREMAEEKLSSTLSNTAFDIGKKTKARLDEQKKVIKLIKSAAGESEELNKIISEIITPPITSEDLDLTGDPEEALEKEVYDWVCADLGIIAGDSIMLSADPFTGKTYLANYLAICIITGKSIFNKYKVQKTGKVAILNWDSNPRPCLTSLRRLLAGMETRIDDKNVLSYETPLWKMDQPLAYQHLKKICTGRVLTIIDSFRSCFTGNEDKSEFTAPIIELANRVSKETNCTILFISHTGKSGTEKGLQANRGSSAVPAATGSLWTLERGINSNTCKLVCHKGRDFNFGKLAYQYKETGKFIEASKKTSRVEMTIVEGECSGANEEPEVKKDIPTQVKEYLFLNEDKNEGMTKMKSKIHGNSGKIDLVVKEMIEKNILTVKKINRMDCTFLSEEAKKEVAKIFETVKK